ncbi:flagellar biosynthesis protein FlhB [Afifella sp. IM 167]|uniref:flagellar biosynthesis protein FlhB n=1 Tax=Afifella sp. IM 167 TaxID=2033586 RepID=UPI001CCFA886|nr:flagellar biosynthesis protein FlhB [Afifella sp. IM 167]MBZ8131788.1 flagellar biosynthesis protein FlhB [Afifella sp. IM 167]
MSEEDKESKTEEPTEKKISDAIEKGNTPFSREATVFASMLAILVVLSLLIQSRVVELTNLLVHFIDDPGAFSLANGTETIHLLWRVALESGKTIIPVIAVLGVFGLAGSLFQNAPSLVLERIKPQWSRLSPTKGWEKLFGKQGLVEFAKSLFKFVAVGFVALIIIRADQSALAAAMYTDPTQMPALILSISVRLVASICVATIVLVAADLVWSRVRWRTDLRMSKQELKEEFKQAEGDPIVKGRLRSIARERARHRMMAAVPPATMVIANPTHYAIAIRYDRQEGGAPMVVAKGADLVALKIREIADKHNIPIVEDKPLARALYKAVEVDQWIPAEFYVAVAKLLHYIYARDSHAAR